jgi:chorismate mutase
MQISWSLQFQASGHENRGEGKIVSGEMDSTNKELSDWRDKIDALDEQLVKLISERAAAANAIGEIKHKHGMSVYEPRREQAVFEHVRTVNPGPLPDQEMQHIFERIMDVMRSLQRRA